MTKLRQLWLLTALGSLAVVAGGYFLLVSPKASKAAALRDEAETQLQTNARIRSQVQMLNRQKKDLPKQQAEFEKFATKIPANTGMPSLIRSLADAADDAGVELVNVAPGAPQVAQMGTPDSAARVDATGTTAATTSTGIPVASIPISVVVTGNYVQLSQFFSEVEGLPRAFLVSGFQVTPGNALDKKNAAAAATAGAVQTDALTASITGQLYMTTNAPAVTTPTTAATAAK